MRGKGFALRYAGGGDYSLRILVRFFLGLIILRGAGERGYAQVSLPLFPPAKAQRITLPVFLNEVRRNALAIRQAGVALRPVQAELQQAYAAFFPSLNASASATQNYGTTFDPFAFDRVQQTTTFASGSVSAGWIIFAGLANHYLLRQARANAALTQASYRRTQTEVLAQALIQFSQTLSDSFLIALSHQRIERLRDQLRRFAAQAQAGQVLSADSLSISAQIAREEAQYLTLYNRHRENKLFLLQLMGWDSVSVDSVEFSLGVEVPDLGLLTEEEAIQLALRNAPEIEEARWRTVVQTYSLRAARAAYFPTLSLGASLQTNYSSNAGNVRFDPARGLVREPLSFERQVRENFNQSISLSLSVPIFQQLRRRTQVARAEGALRSAEIQVEIQRQQVVRRTQQAYLAWRNALQQEAALRYSVEASQRALQQAQIQYEAGRLSYWGYREALLTATQAQLELEQARLDKAFRAILLAAYTGKYTGL
ncbi:MAG: TolC family protein [Bacteroidia bacterium]|nr:TolC family protein [Bacteroidia bacterium]MCX7763814.1 TolC family protein [Bacteroidia bacterium]MDW8056648.1 TolC family protein [Bacteroidia bacterium]